MKLTNNEHAVLIYLRGKSWTSPTEIGREVGGIGPSGRFRHSSWASPICKKLVAKELVKRNERGWYKII